jgi:hypothetical protein
LRCLAADLALEGEQSIHALAAAVGAPTVPVPASMAPLLTVTAELAIEPLTTIVPALAVVAPSSCCWR